MLGRRNTKEVRMKKKKCAYCNKEIQENEKFCSKGCKDNYETATTVNQIKGIVMDKMREVAKGDVEREVLYLKGLRTCLEFDIKEKKR